MFIWPCRSTMFWYFSKRKHMYSALTYDIMKTYLTRVRDKKICNNYIALETSVLCDKIFISITLFQTSPGFYMSAVQVFLQVF